MTDTAKILKALGVIGVTMVDGEPPALNEAAKSPVNAPQKALDMEALVNACMPDGTPVFSAGLPEA